MKTRICTKCKKRKSLELFSRESRRLSGYGPRCKACTNLAVHQRAEKYRAARHRLHIPQKKICARCGRRRFMNQFFKDRTRLDGHWVYCRECYRKYSREYRTNNRPQLLTRKKKYYKSHRAARLVANKQYFEKHKARIRRQQRLYKWWQKHPEVARTNVIRRRARLKRALGSFTPVEWKWLLNVVNNKCVKCGRGDEAGPLHADHVIPIGPKYRGSNNIENIQPLCGHCNFVKGQRPVDYRPKSYRISTVKVTHAQTGYMLYRRPFRFRKTSRKEVALAKPRNMQRLSECLHGLRIKGIARLLLKVAKSTLGNWPTARNDNP